MPAATAEAAAVSTEARGRAAVAAFLAVSVGLLPTAVCYGEARETRRLPILETASSTTVTRRNGKAAQTRAAYCAETRAGCEGRVAKSPTGLPAEATALSAFSRAAPGRPP